MPRGALVAGRRPQGGPLVMIEAALLQSPERVLLLAGKGGRDAL